MPRAPRHAAENLSSKSYVVPCSSTFRDSVLDLAARRKVNPGELARAVLLLLPAKAAAFPDPGEPEPGDRETVILKTGANAGKHWRRKPRLQVRTLAGRSAAQIRAALALALAMEGGEVTLTMEDGGAPTAAEKLTRAQAEIAHLRRQVQALSFEPLANGVRSRAQALHILGLAPGAVPDAAEIRHRYRKLAAIHHPDGGNGDHKRMSQLNEAVRILRGKG
ncbi:MAG: DnaJ domain-containing protein [Rhodospirillales bacterium]|nr:MAG: DnaJ domain-containing protein [Rhodospirillales bacterium]